jgi:hypothetical protein
MTSSLRTTALVLFILLAAFTRLIPHAPNFTAIGALALFGGAYFADKKWAIAVPLLALYLSDIALNTLLYRAYYPGLSFLVPSPWIYGAVLGIVLLGHALLRRPAVPTVLVSSLTASTLFFLVTNLAVWIDSAMYPRTLSGLLLCYEAALPFFGNTLAGDLVYSTVLFGGFALLSQRFPALRAQRA